MKLTNKYMMFAIAALLLASCDLDKYPEGQYVSDNQKEETIKDRPNLVTAEVNAMAAKLNAYGTISDDATTYHNDYGVPAVSMALESGGQDLVALVTGYNWFNTSQNYSDRVYDSSTDRTRPAGGGARHSARQLLPEYRRTMDLQTERRKDKSRARAAWHRSPKSATIRDYGRFAARRLGNYNGI